MKKLFISIAMSLGALTLSAQAPQEALTFSVPEMIGTGEPIVANVEYAEVHPGNSTIEHYKWEIRHVTEDGEIEEPLFSQSYDGDPSGEFQFPEAVTALLERENKYQLTLSGTNNLLDIIYSGPKTIYYSNYVLTSPKEICCGDKFSVIGNYSGDPVFTLGMTHEWTVYECTAAGNIISSPYFYSGVKPGYPFGTFTFPSMGFLCDRYYRVQVTFSPSNDPFAPRPVTRYVIVHLTSFMITASANYCNGNYIWATGRYCGNSTAVVNHQWKAFSSDAAGTILSQNLVSPYVIPGVPNGVNELVYGSELLAPGWYVLQLDFLDGSNAVQGSATQLIYVNPIPQAAITGSVTCASGSFSASPVGIGYSYQWSAFNGNTAFTGVSPNGSNCFVGTGIFNTVKVTVTSPGGCTSQATKSVTTQYVDPGFHIQVIPYGPPNTDYYIALVRNNTAYGTWILQNVPTDQIWIEGISPYSPAVSVPCWTSNASWQAPDPINLSGYNGTGLTSSLTCLNYQLGHFQPGTTYRVTHSVTFNGCTTIGYLDFNQNGCIGCRTAGPEEVTVETAPSFGVYPNPGNGSFTIQLPEATENAQAELFDMMGKHVDGFTFSGTSYTYAPAQTLAPGVYMLNVINNGARSIQKLIVE
ncbi:MAG: T9SS type A sorting domain-containing protein [Bacteroidia bacterium]